MPCFKRIILLSVATVVALASAPAAGDDDRAALTRPPAGSIAAQLRLKRNLLRITSGSLVSSLKHNREAWENLTPDERGRFRKSYLAYLRKNRAEQAKLLEYYEKIFKMPPERREAWRLRAKWLAVVVQSFTPKQRKALEQMSPDDQARKILARKALLIKQGRLKADTPTSLPASAPGPRM